MPNVKAIKAFGDKVDFGKTASDYGRFRAGFPEDFFGRLADQLAFSPGDTALDIGTGTGTVARGLARRGLAVSAVDPAPALLREAAELDRAEGLVVDYREGRAENLEFADASFDIVTAGQCWHWFDRRRAAREALRVLRPGAALVIAHFDWLPLAGNVVEATEALIQQVNPVWTLAGGTGIYPEWLGDAADAGFAALETRSFDIDQPYSHEAWCGRILASAGVSATLDEVEAMRFDARLRALLGKSWPEDPLAIPHRVWWLVARRPG